MTFVEAEIASQPDCWRQAVDVARELSVALGESGERIALVGCGTSWFVGQVAAAWREGAGLGETDAFTASEVPAGRRYDRVIALTRSGTTTEVLDQLGAVRGRVPTTVVLGDLDTPGPGAGRSGRRPVLRRRAVGGPDPVRHQRADALPGRLAR